jgi:hypothetical protein
MTHNLNEAVLYMQLTAAGAVLWGQDTDKILDSGLLCLAN